MANYNKSFNFRNGVQVDTDKFIVNTAGLVGIGSTLPTNYLDVQGGASVTGDIKVIGWDINEESRKNFNTDSTEFYNASYQYSNDCLSASLEFQRDFYSDRDITAEDSLRFTLRIKPFTSLSAPAYKGF